MARRIKKHKSPKSAVKKVPRAPLDTKAIRTRRREIAAMRRKAEKSAKSIAALEKKAQKAKSAYDAARSAIKVATKAPRALKSAADKAERSLKSDVNRMVKGEMKVMRLLTQLQNAK